MLCLIVLMESGLLEVNCSTALSTRLEPFVRGQVRRIQRRTKYTSGIFQTTVNLQPLWTAVGNLLLIFMYVSSVMILVTTIIVIFSGIHKPLDLPQRLIKVLYSFGIVHLQSGGVHLPVALKKRMKM